MIPRGLIGALGLGLAKERAKRQLQSAAAQAALIAAAALMMLFVLGFAGVAAMLALTPVIGPVHAALSVAGVFTLVALILWLAARNIAHKARRQNQPVMPEPVEIARDARQKAETQIRENALLVVLGAFIAGFLLKRR